MVVPHFGKSKNEVDSLTKNKISPMPVKLNAIEYIIIDKQGDFSDILNVLKDLSSDNKVEYEFLVSKLITARQIEKDF
jgi:hypothetical protein